MNIEQERAEFEAWYQHHHGDRDVYALDESGEYTDKQVQGAFNVWQARAALQSQDREDESCKWHNYPETDNVWDTDCGQSFEIYEGTPTENGMGFCCYCGKPIREAIDHARRVEGDGE